uniref:Uncharacterized protein n=1 Tax=Lygus hesperus TaxID=30085 RepID=A0A146M311_LYGHE
MLEFLPSIILTSRLCPRGSESLIYSLMAGIGNFGQAIASSLGAIFLEYIWPVQTSTPCNFDNLPMLTLFGNMLVPLLSIPASYLLLPNTRVCDDIDMDGNVIQKEIKKGVTQTHDVKHDKENASKTEPAQM